MKKLLFVYFTLSIFQYSYAQENEIFSVAGACVSSSGEQLKTTNKRIGIKNRFFKLLIFNYLNIVLL